MTDIIAIVVVLDQEIEVIIIAAGDVQDRAKIIDVTVIAVVGTAVAMIIIAGSIIETKIEATADEIVTMAMLTKTGRSLETVNCNRWDWSRKTRHLCLNWKRSRS